MKADTPQLYPHNNNMNHEADTPRCKAIPFMTTDTPRTDAAIELYGERPFIVAAVPVEFAEGLERELCASKAEVERLKKLVMEAARKGDELLDPYRLRAEKAETLLKQIHAFVEALNPTDKWEDGE